MTTTLELSLVFVAGFLGSYHCIGMCGPLALALGSSRPELAMNTTRQLIYSVGRIFTYAFLGSVAGYAGLRLTRANALSPTGQEWLAQSGSTSLVNIQAWLAVVAGILLIIFGLMTTGILPKRSAKAGGGITCLAATWLKTFLTSPSPVNVFLAGVFTGFIPCGLVYIFLAKAASTASVPVGAATMVAFGFGTVPLMVLTGCGGSLLGHVTRARLMKVAAWCIVVTGAISVARGAVNLDQSEGDSTPPACPLCDE